MNENEHKMPFVHIVYIKRPSAWVTGLSIEVGSAGLNEHALSHCS